MVVFALPYGGLPAVRPVPVSMPLKATSCLATPNFLMRA